MKYLFLFIIFLVVSLLIVFLFFDVKIKWVEKLSKFQLFSIIVIVIICVFGIIGHFSGDEKTPIQLERDAFIFAKIIVTDKLKAPSTAEFQSYDPKLVRVSGDKYFIRSYVDAQNSFGTKTRTYYEIELVRKEENFSVVRLDIQE